MLTYGLPITPGSLTLHAYSNLGWASDSLDRCSTTKYCMFLGSTLISWKVRKQKTVSLSSTKAEYHALAATTIDLIWLW